MKIKNSGHLWAILSYSLWGFFPLYWKLLAQFRPLEILAHRVFWSFFFYGFLLFILRKKILWRIPKSLFLAAILVSVNWFLYIYAVNSGQVLQGSLAYFMTPFINLLFAYFLFAEKFKMKHKISIILAFIGVGFLLFEAKNFPWLALAMALTFSFYGVIKKRIHISPLQSGFLETMALLPLAFAAILFFRLTNPPATSVNWILLLGTGIVTGLPLWGFAESVQKIPYSAVGMYQFISPSIQFILGVFVYHESLSPIKWTAFVLIWFAVLLYLAPTRLSFKSNMN